MVDRTSGQPVPACWTDRNSIAALPLLLSALPVDEPQPASSAARPNVPPAATLTNWRRFRRSEVISSVKDICVLLSENKCGESADRLLELTNAVSTMT